MDFRVASYYNTEVITIVLFDESDKIDSVVKAVLLVHPIGLADWWVSSQSEDVSNATFFGLHYKTRAYGFKCFDNLFTRHEGTCQVHEDIQPGKVLQMIAQVKSDL